VAPGQVAPDEALRLAEAFRMFSRASEELSGAYSELQGQMARLTGNWRPPTARCASSIRKRRR
jgi:hypothetical protein